MFRKKINHVCGVISCMVGLMGLSAFAESDEFVADPAKDGLLEYMTFEEQVQLPFKEVTVDLYIPIDDKKSPFPIVVFNHGFSAKAKDYAGYGGRLASHGFLTVMPSMDGFLKSLNHNQLLQISYQLNNWIVSSAKTPGSRLYGVADVSRIAVGGHSRGGKQGLSVATIDERVKASFNLDPVDSGPPLVPEDPKAYPSLTPEEMDKIEIPTGYIGGGKSVQGRFGIPCAPEHDNYFQFYIHSPSPSYSYYLPEAGHNDFRDECGFTCKIACSAGKDPQFTRDFSRMMMVAFYKVFLNEDEKYRSWLEGEKLEKYRSKISSEQH